MEIPLWSNDKGMKAQNRVGVFATHEILKGTVLSKRTVPFYFILNAFAFDEVLVGFAFADDPEGGAFDHDLAGARA